MSEHANVQPVPSTRLDAAGIVSVGRLNFSLTDHLVYMHSAELGIPITPNFGLFWDQQVSNRIEAILRKLDCKYILFFDGDGAWSIEQIRELYRLIEHETVDGKRIDAIYPTQPCRKGAVPLAYNWMARELTGQDYDYSGELTADVHGHFGLTFIRTEALRQLEKPYLWGQPSPETGSWLPGSPGKMDADTYFWIKFRDSGFTAARANKVIIGHQELMVRWQRGTEVVAQSIHDFQERGAPEGLRTPTVDEYQLIAPPEEGSERGEPGREIYETVTAPPMRLDPRVRDLQRPVSRESGGGRRGDKRIISFSLWGDAPKYILGMLENLRLAPLIYPGWTVRIYADPSALCALCEHLALPVMEGDGPHAVDTELDGAPCHLEVVPRPTCLDAEGMFWRFEPAGESDLDALIVRDADSRLNPREKAAVDAWLASGLDLHLMRDDWRHAQWLVLGGMWGVRGGVIPTMRELIQSWRGGHEKLADQYFLSLLMGPLVQQGRAVQHVREGIASPFGGTPFPDHDPWDGQYVGEIVEVAEQEVAA